MEAHGLGQQGRNRSSSDRARGGARQTQRDTVRQGEYSIEGRADEREAGARKAKESLQPGRGRQGKCRTGRGQCHRCPALYQARRQGNRCLGRQGRKCVACKRRQGADAFTKERGGVEIEMPRPRAPARRRSGRSFPSTTSSKSYSTLRSHILLRTSYSTRRPETRPTSAITAWRKLFATRRSWRPTSDEVNTTFSS